MAGLDFMTIASWLGHSDGGVLVGKVYGHLTDAHKRRMADGLRILKKFLLASGVHNFFLYCFGHWLVSPSPIKF